MMGLYGSVAKVMVIKGGFEMFGRLATALISRFEKERTVPCTPARQFQERMNLLVEGIDGLILNMMADGEDGVFISYMRVPLGVRRTGVGARVLSALVECADELDVRLILNATQMDYENGPTHEELVAFYGKYGFSNNWEYESACTAMFEAKRDGSWTRMVRPANSFVLSIKI